MSAAGGAWLGVVGSGREQNAGVGPLDGWLPPRTPCPQTHTPTHRSLPPGSVEFAVDVPTLAAGSVCGGRRIAQVFPQGVRLLGEPPSPEQKHM